MTRADSAHFPGAKLGDRIRVKLTHDSSDADGAFPTVRFAGQRRARTRPFVMNTESEIRQAVSDFRSGRIRRA